MDEQFFVDTELPRLHQVVGMNDKTHTPMPFHNDLDLLFPDGDGVIAQNIVKGVILHRCDRDFEDPILKEIWHHRATTAALGIEMRHIGNGHIKRKLQRIEPDLLTVQHGSTEAFCTELLSIFINPGGPAQKLFIVL